MFFVFIRRLRDDRGAPTVDVLANVPLLIHRLFDRDVIYDLSHAFDSLGEVCGPVLLISRIDKAAQLDRALERFHVYTLVLILTVLSERPLDTGGSGPVINVLACALLVATAGATGHAQE